MRTRAAKTPPRSGVCRYCGCTDARACVDLYNVTACSWGDQAHTWCTARRCWNRAMKDGLTRRAA